MSGDAILIVDDNPTNLKLASVLLAAEGYTVHTATSADDALRTLWRCPARLVLLDIQLAGMDGLELSRRLRADPVTRHLIILAVTACAMVGDEERVIAAGCDGYLAKPIDTRALPAVVAGLLARDRHPVTHPPA